jgi:hypothetical protein
MDTQHMARHLGPQLVTFLKIIFILCFIILSLVNRDIKWFKQQPGKTIGEALVAGICAALSFAIVAQMRGMARSKTLWLFGGSFVVFTALQMLFELAGFNELSGEADTGGKKFAEDTSKIKKNKYIWALGIVVIFVMLSFMIAAWDTPFPKTPGNIPEAWARTTPQFLGEMLVIGLGSAIPSIMVTKDRGGKTKQIITNFMAGLFLFGVLAHPALQYSGVYREIGLWADGPLPQNAPNFSLFRGKLLRGAGASPAPVSVGQ